MTDNALKDLFNKLMPPTYWEELKQKYAGEKKVLKLIEQCNNPGVTLPIHRHLEDIGKALAGFGEELLADVAKENKEEMMQKNVDLQAKHMESWVNTLGERTRKQLDKYFEMNIENKTLSKLTEVTTVNASNLLEQNKVSLFYFSASWCGPCKRLAPVISGLVDGYEGKAFIGKVDIDAQQELAAQYGIKSVPTMIFFKAGQEQQRMVGFQEAKVIRDAIDALL